MNKRLTSLMLLTAILTSAASCGGSADHLPPDTQDTSSEVTTNDPNRMYDAVPELDFGGAEFRTIEQDSTVNSFYAEEEVGDVVIDAIYNRNRAMEERFNVTFTETQREKHSTIMTLVTNSVMSGSDDYDLVFGQMFQSAKNAVNGIFADWNKVPHIDLSKPYYTKSIKEASVGDKLFMIESDLCVMYTEQTWLMVYNQTKAQNYSDIPDLYELVREGKWTLDTLDTIVSGLYSDVNGNTTRDAGDFFGFGANQDGCQVAAFVYGCGASLVKIDSDLQLTHTIESEKTINVLTKLAEFFNVNDGSMRKSDNIATSVHSRREHFLTGNILFAPLQVCDLVADDMRDLKDSYGVLPLPKYDEAQEEYFTVVDGGANIMTIPATATDEQLEMIGALVEAMSCASYNDVTPAYCELALEQKGTRDEESMEMLRLVLDSRIIDFAYLYDASSGWVMQLPMMVQSADSIMSTIASKKSAIDEYYNTVIDFCVSSNN